MIMNPWIVGPLPADLSVLLGGSNNYHQLSQQMSEENWMNNPHSYNVAKEHTLSHRSSPLLEVLSVVHKLELLRQQQKPRIRTYWSARNGLISHVRYRPTNTILMQQTQVALPCLPPPTACCPLQCSCRQYQASLVIPQQQNYISNLPQHQPSNMPFQVCYSADAVSR
jgi:hypothetical protein